MSINIWMGEEGMNTYIWWNSTSHEKEWNIIFSNIDGSIGDHTKWIQRNTSFLLTISFLLEIMSSWLWHCVILKLFYFIFLMTPPTFIVLPRLPQGCLLSYVAFCFLSLLSVIISTSSALISMKISPSLLLALWFCTLNLCYKTATHLNPYTKSNTSGNQSRDLPHKIHLISANASSSSAQLSALGITFLLSRSMTQFSFSVALSHLSFLFLISSVWH